MKEKKALFFATLLLLFLGNQFLFAQNIAINDNAADPNTKALLDISVSTNNKGVLFPRVTTAQMNAITGTTAQGLLVYNTTENMFYYNKSTNATVFWVPLLSSAGGSSTGIGGWSLTSNSGTNATTNFLGTPDGQDIVFKTGGSLASNQRMRINTSGYLGIGTLTSITYPLTLDGTGNIFGVENTAYFVTKNNSGTYQNFLYPRWSDNVMYSDYGANGFNIRTNASSLAMFMDNNCNVGINSTPGEKLDVGGNIIASYTGSVYPIVYWGNSGSRTESRDNAGLQGNAGALSGFYETSAPSPAANWPPGATSWWHLLDIRHSNPANNYAMQFAGSFFDQELWFRKTNDNPGTSWKLALTWNRRYTTSFSGTTEFFADEYVKFRWNSSKLEISARYGQAGNWAVFSESEEHSFSGDQSPHSMATSVNAAVGSWAVVGAPDPAEQPASGLTFYLSRDNSNAYPVYYIEVLVHGNKVSFVVQRVNP